MRGLALRAAGSYGDTPREKGNERKSQGASAMTQPKPPFRADHVGSILRTAPLKDARAKRERGEITAARFQEVEDREIERIIRRQEDIGLKLATDGEFRRSWWHIDFLRKIDGVESFKIAHGIQFHGVQARVEGLRVKGKLDFTGHPFLDHFRFLRDHAKVMPKLTIPAPSVLHFRLEENGLDKDVYPTLDGFFDDLGKVYRKAVKAFYDSGCRYLQFDDTIWAYLCSEVELEKARERMADVDVSELQKIYARVINYAIAEKPADMTITTHVCRGNFRSTWISTGGYEPVAETLLGKLGYDGYFLEYDTERAGGFEPLRFLPKGNKRVVLGLITTKVGTLENKDVIKRRVEEAAKYVDINQLCLSPQCGFASTEEGNILAEDEQWAKLRMVVELAGQVWG